MARTDTWNSGAIDTLTDYNTTQTVTVPRTFPAGSILAVKYKFITSSESYVHTLSYSSNNSTWTTVKTSGFSYHYTDVNKATEFTFTLANPCRYVRTISQTSGVASVRTWYYKLTAYYYTITASQNNTSGGTVSGGAEYAKGATCTLKATPATGYKFVCWKNGNTQVSTNATYSFTVSADATITAYFELLTYSITVNASPTEGGTVSGGGTKNYNSTATVTATPATGYKFVCWKEGSTQVSTNASYSFTVTGARTLTAYFELLTYSITVNASPTEGGTVSGGGTKNYNSTATVVATPATGYKFVCWKEGSTQVSTNASYSFTVTSARTLTAYFESEGNCYIKINGVWKYGTFYMKVNGSWQKVDAWVKTNNGWKKCT